LPEGVFGPKVHLYVRGFPAEFRGADATFDRRKLRHHIGRGLVDMALPLETLYHTASRKEEWWKREMAQFLGLPELCASTQ
jgi:hypothetical protein